jgi:hypothetical protein
MRLLFVKFNLPRRIPELQALRAFRRLLLSLPVSCRVLQANRKILASSHDIGRQLVFCIHPFGLADSPTSSNVTHPCFAAASRCKLSVLPLLPTNSPLIISQTTDIALHRINLPSLCPEQRATSSSPPTRLFTYDTMSTIS